MYAIEAYQRAMEPQALGWHADDEGAWQKLDNKGWGATRKKILTGIGGSICLIGRPDVTTGHKVIYSGYRFEHSEFSTKPDTACAITFHLLSAHRVPGRAWPSAGARTRVGDRRLTMRYGYTFASRATPPRFSKARACFDTSCKTRGSTARRPLFSLSCKNLVTDARGTGVTTAV